MIQTEVAYISKSFSFFARAGVCAITVLFAAFQFVGSTDLISTEKKTQKKLSLQEMRAARTSEKNPLKRHRMNQDIVHSQEPGISSALIESLQTDVDPMVQTGAAQELGNYVQNPGVVEALVNALANNPSNSVRMAAARSLSISKSPLAINALCAAAADPDPFVRKQVAFGLKSHKTKPAKAAIKKLKKDQDKSVREMAGAVKP